MGAKILTPPCRYVWPCFIKHMVRKSNYLLIQDGSYSRGPMNIPIEEADETNYYLTPTFKVEQVSHLLPHAFFGASPKTKKGKAKKERILIHFKCFLA